MRLLQVAAVATLAAMIAACGSHEATKREEASSRRPSKSYVMTGMYSYMADAGVFTECRTGKKLPVAQEAANAKLESAYLDAKQAPGEPVLVVIEGFVADRPRMEGEGTMQAVVVNEVLHVRPGENCPPPSTAPLVNTYWKLLELDGERVVTPPGRRELYVILTTNESRVKGFAGCNAFTGTYEVRGDSLRFGPLASTRMACPDYMEQETRFLRALEATVGYRIDGEMLEILGASGSLAMFESVYFR